MQQGPQLELFQGISIQPKFLHQLKLPRNATKGARTTPQLQFHMELTVIHGGLMQRKFGTKWDLCRQSVDFQKIQEVALGKGAANNWTHDELFSHCFRHLKFYYDQTYCKWVDVDSFMSNVTMEYDLVMMIFLIGPIDAKSLDKFVRKSWL